MNDLWWIQETELDEEQIAVIDLDTDKSFVVTGPPGSGKSNLLLLRASYLSKVKPNLQVVVFTRTLQDFLRSGADKYQIPPSRITTSSAFFDAVLREHGVAPYTPTGQGDEFEAKRAYTIAKLKQLREATKLEKTNTTILLDEAQDYLAAEIDAFFALSDHVFAVADGKQRIYDADEGVARLETSAKKVSLTKHYRSGLAICRCADHINQLRGLHDEMLVPGCNYDEATYKSFVEALSFESEEAASARLTERLREQLAAYPGSLIGVLVPRKKELANLVSFIRTEAPEIADECCFQDPGSNSATFDPSKRVVVSTIHAAKGLEYRAVNLVLPEYLHGFPSKRRLAYVGITRTKTSFVVYHVKALPPYLAGAVAAGQPPPEKPSMKKVFGG